MRSFIKNAIFSLMLCIALLLLYHSFEMLPHEAAQASSLPRRMILPFLTQSAREAGLFFDWLLSSLSPVLLRQKQTLPGL